MSKDPAVLFYTSDFLSGTSFFSMEQRGQYITLLCQQHQLGEIPENHMINICGSLDSVVIKKFIKNEQGNYFNKRMKDEAEKRRTFCLSRSNNKSGRKKKEITSKSYENHKIIHMENENDNVIINSNKKDINNKTEEEYLNQVIKNWVKFYPEEFKKNGHHQVSYVMQRRKELEKISGIDNIIEYVKTYHNKTLLLDGSFFIPEKPKDTGDIWKEMW